jgi:hypothetical protein
MDRSLTPTESTLAFFIFLPFLLLLFPGFNQLFDGLAFWLAMFICASVVWLTVLIRSMQIGSVRATHRKHDLVEEEYPLAIKQVMDVEAATEENGIMVYRGQLKELASAAHDRLKQAFADQTVILLPVRDDGGRCSTNKGCRAAIMLVGKTPPKGDQRSQAVLEWFILAITVGASLCTGMK